MPSLELLAGVLVGALAFLVWLLSAPTRQLKRVPAGGGALPVLGDMLFYMREAPRIWDAHLEAFGRVGETFARTMCGTPHLMIYISGRRCIEHVLHAQFERYEKGAVIEPFGELLGEGIFNTDGAKWRRQRKIMSHMFAQRVMREDLARIADAHAEALCGVLERRCEDRAEFDAQDLMMRFTFDAICEICFGGRMGALEGRDVPFMRHFDEAQRMSNQRFYNPLWKVLRWFGASGNRELMRHVEAVRSFAMEMVVRRRAAGDDGTDTAAERRHPDLLSRFMRDASAEYSDGALRDVLLSMMIAGRDTTAVLLTWALHELERNPDEEARLLDEIREARREGGQAEKFASRLVRLEAFLLEVLRLHPPVPADGKMCVKRDVLPDGTVVLPGNLVLFVPYAMGRDPARFPDPLRVDPGRHLRRDEATGRLAVSPPDQYDLPVFNAGPRLCLGRRMALLEAKLLLAKVLPRFKIRAAPGAPEPRYAVNVLLTVEGGLPVRVERR